MIVCKVCRHNSTEGRFRICDDCLSSHARRLRKRRITPKNVVRGTHWSYNKAPAIKGIIDSVHTGGYVHVQIDDKNGDFSWISSIDDFLASWTEINSDVDLDIE